MFKPLNDYIAVKPYKREQDEMFAYNEASSKRPNLGEIVEISDNVAKTGLIAVGDKVFWPEFLGTKLDIDGQVLYFLKLEDVFCKL